MFSSVPQNTPENIKYGRVLESVHRVTAMAFGEVKEQADQRYFDPLAPEKSKYKCLLYYPEDKAGKRLEGRNPSVWHKLFSRSIGTAEYGTLFSQPKPVIDLVTKERVKEIGPDGTERDKIVLEPIEWDLLKGKTVKYIPLTHISHIHSGATGISLQTKLKSAIVLDVSPINTESQQVETAYAVVNANPELLTKLDKQVADARASRPLGLVEHASDESKGKETKAVTSPTALVVAGSVPPPAQMGYMGAAEATIMPQ